MWKKYLYEVFTRALIYCSHLPSAFTAVVDLYFVLYFWNDMVSRVQFLMNNVGEGKAKEEKMCKFSPPLQASLGMEKKDGSSVNWWKCVTLSSFFVGVVWHTWMWLPMILWTTICLYIFTHFHQLIEDSSFVCVPERAPGGAQIWTYFIPHHPHQP